MVANPVSEDDQAAKVVTSLLDLSLQPAVAVNCCVLPTLTDALVGVSDIAVTTGVPPPVLTMLEEPLPPPHATVASMPRVSPSRRSWNPNCFNPQWFSLVTASPPSQIEFLKAQHEYLRAESLATSYRK